MRIIYIVAMGNGLRELILIKRRDNNSKRDDLSFTWSDDLKGMGDYG
jgi:hypothetical protein